MSAIAKKEFRVYFLSPIGYVFCGVMLLLFGFFYYAMVLNTQSTDYIPYIYSSIFPMMIMFLLPLVTMRTFSEEIRTKSDQGLLTAPVSVFGIVAGKFLAAVEMFAIGLAGTLVPALIITFMSQPDWAKIFCTVVGCLLCGAALIAVGNFISSLTQSQLVAGIATFGVLMFLFLIGNIAGNVSNAALQNVLNWISFDARFQPFTKGVFNLSSIVYFVSVAAVFLFLTARKLESRRWS